jgi:hypothetical protein
MGKKKDKAEIVLCPVGKFFMDLEKISGKKSDFFEHLNLSRIEFLKAIQSLVEERIDDLERKGSKTGKRKAKKIAVE